MQLFSAQEYLAIDIANNYGLDKLNWDDRLLWFQANEDKLESHLPDAEESALYSAGVRAWRRAQEGKPISYPISLDATASGLQLLSVLTGDRSGASLCNVIDTGKREDAYTSLHLEIQKRLGEDSPIVRGDSKHAIMTAFYGSQRVPKDIFGEGKELTTFYQVLTDKAPGCWALNSLLLALWDPQASVYQWTLPDNFHARIKVFDKVEEKINFLGSEHSIYRKVNRPVEEGRSLSA